MLDFNFNMIIVEGQADKVFIKQYLNYLGMNIPDDNIQVSKGKNNLDTLMVDIEKYNDFTVNTKSRCLIIFDSDNDFDLSRKNIINTLKNNNLQAEVFLFPNNESIGDLETLLEQIVRDEKRAILKCFEGYEHCLETLKENKENPIVTYTPARKSKIYSYLEVQLDSNTKREEAKEIERDYTNKKFWNLESPALDNLKSFLMK